MRLAYGVSVGLCLFASALAACSADGNGPGVGNDVDSGTSNNLPKDGGGAKNDGGGGATTDGGGKSEGGTKTDAGGSRDSGTLPEEDAAPDPTPRRDAGRDSGPVRDSGPTPDSGRPDSGRPDSGPVGDAGPLACAPQSVTGFTPPAYHPALRVAGACPTTLLNEFMTELTTGGDFDAFLGPNADAAHSACFGCMVTDDTAPRYGALIASQDFITVNIPGCLEIRGNTSCATAISNTDACDTAACYDSCSPFVDDQSFVDLDACFGAANAGGCATYFNASETCKTAAAAATQTATCLAGNTFEDYTRNIGAVLCGP